MKKISFLLQPVSDWCHGQNFEILRVSILKHPNKDQEHLSVIAIDCNTIEDIPQKLAEISKDCIKDYHETKNCETALKEITIFKAISLLLERHPNGMIVPEDVRRHMRDAGYRTDPFGAIYLSLSEDLWKKFQRLTEAFMKKIDSPLI